MEEKIFIAFLDDDGKEKKDWAILLERTDSYIKFKYQKNILTIPWQRILKVKEVKNE